MIFRVAEGDGSDGVGRWHVFFQHNPAGPVHGDIHWGHASSDDLVHWDEHPVAFGPTSGGPDSGGCWSGVAVEVGDGRVAAVYTGIAGSPTASSTCVRYAADAALDVWSPPLVAGGVPDLVALGAADCAIHEVRDPFVFPHGGRRWALLGGGLTDGTPIVLLWSCDDLEAWEFERVWLSGADPVLAACAPAEIWECPQLVEVDGEAVVLLSTWTQGRLEGTTAVLGALTAAADGSPAFTPRTGGRLDEGPAFYAPQVALDADGPWLFGWVKEDDRPDLGPDGVAGCLTLPRRLGVHGDRVVSRPDPRALAGLPASAVSDQPDGSLVVTDDDVVETYPPDGVPVTRRRPRAGES